MCTRRGCRAAETSVRAGGGGGWIRTNVAITAADLQSAPFSHSGTPPMSGRVIPDWGRLVNAARPLRARPPHGTVGRALLGGGGQRLARLRAVQQAGELGALQPHRRGHVRRSRRSRARVVRSASGGLAASARARAGASASASAGVGRTAFTRPAACAAAASNGSPSSSSSDARSSPARAGSSRLEAASGQRPRFTNGSWNRAAAEQYTRSQCSSIVVPTPTAAPLTEATIGESHAISASRNVPGGGPLAGHGAGESRPGRCRR